MAKHPRSKYHIEHLICPSCGEEYNVKVWDIINTRMNPDAIIHGYNDHFIFRCPVCNAEDFINHSVLYDQVENQFGLYYLSLGDSGETINDEDTNIKALKALPKCYEKRVVNSITEFIEKVTIFGACLDDHIVELLKLRLIMMMKEEPDSFTGMLLNKNDILQNGPKAISDFLLHKTEYIKIWPEVDDNISIIDNDTEKDSCQCLSDIRLNYNIDGSVCFRLFYWNYEDDFSVASVAFNKEMYDEIASEWEIAGRFPLTSWIMRNI